MSDNNHITVRGRVGTDPDLFVTSGGREVTRFRLGSTRSFRDTTTGEWRDMETEWFTVKTWGNAAANVQGSIRRGMPVLVQGVLSSEQWESAEGRHHTNVITAHAIGVDIKYGHVKYFKVTREVQPVEPAAAASDTEQAGEGASGDTAGPDAAAAEPVGASADTTRGQVDEGDDGAAADADGNGRAPDLVDSRGWEKVSG